MTSVIRWEEPPEHGNKRAARLKYQDIADELRAHPGRWAVVTEGVPTGTAGPIAVRIRRGQAAFAPAGSFEARTAGGVGSLNARVYARCVGEQS